tara:strand:+ start:532 stop:1497 length:966 start_codon:yes stop_codon:yes gene_type:complete
MRKKIIIISGDPNSVNSELIFKCWKNLKNQTKKNIYLISNYDLLKHQFKKLNYSIKIQKVKNITDKYQSNNLKILSLKLNFDNPFNVSKKSASKFILNSLNYAHQLALNKDVKGIINCPINKNLLKKKNSGITEFLASKCNIKSNSEVMLISNKQLSVSPITTHIDIKDVSKKITKNLIIKKIKTIDNFFKTKFKIKPKIAVLGLNPHNGEMRKNSEERKVIIPAINKLKKLRINVNGPFVSDTIFINNYKSYNVIVGMFHDQVLSPFKSIYKFDAINLTLGLKYLRVSPDHGVAKDLVGKNISNSTSMLNCIKFIDKFGK